MERAYTVVGHYPFPLDMLRRDRARAASAEDQALIDRLSGELSDDGFGLHEKITINLIMDAGDPARSRPDGRWIPLAVRWESFGWEVQGVPEIDEQRALISRLQPPERDDPVRKTERGFSLAEFIDGNGVVCSLQKSSIATADMVWFGCNEIGLKKFVPGEGWSDVLLQHDGPFGVTHIANTRMHLTREQVAQLLPYLQRFVETGDL